MALTCRAPFFMCRATNALIDDSGVDSLEYDKRYGQYRLRLTTKDLTAHRELLLELVRRASKTPPPMEE
jgi:hypothetical protein